jgi:hypothetical protein
MPTPPRSRRSRRILFLLGACWLLLSTVWVARRWHAVQILEQAEITSEVSAEWDLPDWLPPAARDKWGKLWPTSRLYALNVTPYESNSQTLASAARVCGPPEALDVEESEKPGASLAFLRALGRQKSVISLGLDNVAIDEREFPELLRQFPNLQTLGLQNYRFSGAQFPVLLSQSPQLKTLHLKRVHFPGTTFPALPALENVIFDATPLSDEGLAAVLRCPALLVCWLNETAVTTAGVRQVPQWKPKTLAGFGFANSRITREEALELDTFLQNSCPGLQITLTRLPSVRY